MVQTQSVCQGEPHCRVGQRICGQELTVEVRVLIFELIAERRLRPSTRDIVALIVETGAVRVLRIQKEAIRKIEGSGIAASIGPVVLVQSPVIVFVAVKTMLPSRRRGNAELA